MVTFNAHKPITFKGRFIEIDFGTPGKNLEWIKVPELPLDAYEKTSLEDDKKVIEKVLSMEKTTAISDTSGKTILFDKTNLLDIRLMTKQEQKDIGTNAKLVIRISLNKFSETTKKILNIKRYIIPVDSPELKSLTKQIFKVAR